MNQSPKNESSTGGSRPGGSIHLAEFSPYAVLALAPDGTVQDANATAVELTKHLGRTSPAELLPEDAAVIVRNCLASGHKRLGVEAATGGRVLSFSFYPFAAEKVVQCHVTDVTERQRLEAQLRHAQKLESVGRLAAGIAHDFNNLLTVVQGHTGLLRSDPATTPAMKDSVQGIAQAAERGIKLTSQLLAFSRRNVLELRPLDLNEVLTGLSNLLPRTLGEDITYQFQYASDLPLIHADRGLIEQVFMSIAVNARDAMPRGGQLMVSTALVDIDEGYVERHLLDSRLGQFVCLTISDTGCGMDQMTLSRLFEPFFTTKEFGKGTGLGLATVYGIVRQHQGWVEVRSQLGQGTSFKIYLPPATGSEVAASAPAKEPVRLQGNETILVVEDEPPVRWIIKDVLTHYGYNVIEAGNGVEALALWHQHHADIRLLLTDMVMPVGLGGQELAEKFTSQEPALKVIFISGYSLQVAGKGFTRTDDLNFLQKPFDGAKLARAVRQCLDA
jgi:two-component system cell cycle sensor histidine kinase/response regulator CckA